VRADDDIDVDDHSVDPRAGGPGLDTAGGRDVGYPYVWGRGFVQRGVFPSPPRPTWLPMPFASARQRREELSAFAAVRADNRRNT